MRKAAGKHSHSACEPGGRTGGKPFSPPHRSPQAPNPRCPRIWGCPGAAPLPRWCWQGAEPTSTSPFSHGWGLGAGTLHAGCQHLTPPHITAPVGLQPFSAVVLGNAALGVVVGRVVFLEGPRGVPGGGFVPTWRAGSPPHAPHIPGCCSQPRSHAVRAHTGGDVCPHPPAVLLPTGVQRGSSGELTLA